MNTLERLLLSCLATGLAASASAQTKIMPLGDSNTHGVAGQVSYRYELWYDLDLSGYSVDFVGRQFDTLSPPNASWYPDYFTTFDRDHEGYSGLRTDEVAALVIDAANAGLPDVVLLHLGTNDVGQLGAAGVTNADVNLRLIIDRLRSVRPDVVILLAQVIPIGPLSQFGSNEAFIGPLNSVIATIATDKYTAQSPVVLVDQHTGFDSPTMLLADDLHANLVGEARMADVWLQSLLPILEGEPGTAFCFGVGCPCGNDDLTAGCVNSSGAGARLSGAGTGSISADDLILTTSNSPANNSGLYFGANTPFQPAVSVGDGLGCSGGLSFRYFPGTTQPDGTFIKTNLASTAAPGFINPGDTRHFQSWTRDVTCGPPPSPCPSPCGNNNNLSNAYSVTFTP